MLKKRPDFTKTAEQKRSEKREEINARYKTRTRQDWQEVLRTPCGRRVIWAILNEFCVNEVSAFSENPYTSAYLNGKRDVATSIRTVIMRYSRQAIFQMEEEANTDALLLQQEIDSAEKKETKENGENV